MTSQDLELADQEALRRILEEGQDLEDFDENEGGVSRIKMDHKAQTWVDSLSGVAVPSFEGVICGIVKQRVMFSPKMGADPAPPQCKSVDFKIGRPSESFPLQEYLNPTQGDRPIAAGSEITTAAELTEDTQLHCELCPFQHFGSHPLKDNTPRCTEQIVMVVMADLLGSGTLSPSLLTAQRSALKPVRMYLAGFKKAKNPVCSVRTRFRLDGRTFAGNDYVVPILTALDPTDRADWGIYATTFMQSRDFLRRRNDVETSDLVATARPHGNGGDDELEDF